MHSQLQKSKAAFIATVVTLSAVFACHAGVKPGDTFPDLSTFKLEGKLPDLKGKVVIVDFWASWCGPCKESFPAMGELQSKFGPQGLVIIAVNEDEKNGDMEAFLKENKAGFSVVRDGAPDGRKLVDKVEINTMPSSFIIGTDGKVKFAHSGYHGASTKKTYEKEIESLLKK